MPHYFGFGNDNLPDKLGIYNYLPQPSRGHVFFRTQQPSLLTCLDSSRRHILTMAARTTKTALVTGGSEGGLGFAIA